MIEKTMAKWHKMIESKNFDELDALLAEDVTFHSPIVHSPQEGKALTQMYLSAANGVFLESDFRYVREVMSGDSAVLEFTTEIEGIFINGVDMIRCNDEGQIVDFKVMIRPLKAINLLHQQMGQMIQKLASA